MTSSTEIWFLIGLSFIVYFIISYIFKILGIENLKTAIFTKNGVRLLNLRHCIGILLFGCYVFFLPTSRDLLTRIEFPSLSLSLFFLMAVVLSAYVSIQFYRDYKSKSKPYRPFNHGYIGNYILLRILFLLVYEFFFRGILFYSFLEVVNLELSVVLCTSLYMFIHFFDSKAEILGALPFGIILCLFTYYTNNIWMAFYIHVTLSMVYEFSLLNHFKLKNQKS